MSNDARSKPLLGPYSPRTGWEPFIGLFSIIAIGSFVVSVLIDYVPLFLVVYPIGLVAATFCVVMHGIANYRRRKVEERAEKEQEWTTSDM